MANLFDTANVPKTEPEAMTAGDLVQWKRADLGTDYPPSTYDLKYSARLAGTGTTEIEITATASGTDFLVSVASATSALWTAGTYYWQAYITRKSDSERIQIDSGQWVVVSNRDTDTTDPRSHAKIMLDKIEAVLEKRGDADVSNYSVAGRSITKMSPQELLRWRSYYLAQYEAEQDAIRRKRGQATRNTITVRFT